MKKPLETHTEFPDNAPQQEPAPKQVSWRRSLAAGISRNAAQPALHRADAADFVASLRANNRLLEETRPHLKCLSRMLADTPHVVYLTDAAGVILESVSNRDDFHRLGLTPSYDWAEARMGTNSAGTAIANDQPVAVIGKEHYQRALRNYAGAAAPIHDAKEQLIGAIGISTDTREYKPEYLLLASHTAHVIDQALKAQERLREAESIKFLARLSGFTAHELVTPLATLNSLLGMLERMDLPPNAQRLMEMTCQTGRRLQAVVEELRILAGDRNPQLEPVDLAGFLRQLLSGAALPPQIEAQLDCPELPPVLCNRGLLTRALYNLVRNSAESMAGGGRLGLRANETDGSIRITAWDEGPGLSKLQQATLFEDPFTTKSDGSGLGLLLSKAIIERVHDGRLSYSTNSPRGSCFHVDLPLSLACRATPFTREL